MIYCDPDTGVCSIDNTKKSHNQRTDDLLLDNTLFYFGDPMCSWCWGFAPEIEKLRERTADTFGFKLIMGGLRPGGGDPWNDQMKSYLREHWQHVIEKSGQPFSFKLFDKPHFEYDTEPPCRAVKTAQQIQDDDGLKFYHNIQHRFYAESEDPGEIGFYKPICEETGIDFATFKKLFQSKQLKERTQKDFSFSQRLGVQGFPSLVVTSGNQIKYLARGYTTVDKIIQRLQHLKLETS